MKIDLHALRTELLGEELLLFGKKKLKGSPVVRCQWPQQKWKDADEAERARGGMSFGPRHVAKRGFGGCGRTPLFLGPKKKKIDGVRVWQPCSGAIAPAPPKNRILKVLQCRSTSNHRPSFECPLSTSSVVFCVDWKGLRLKFTNLTTVGGVSL